MPLNNLVNKILQLSKILSLRLDGKTDIAKNLFKLVTRKGLYGISKMQLNSFLFIIVPGPQHQKKKRQIKFVHLRQSRILIFSIFLLFNE